MMCTSSRRRSSSSTESGTLLAACIAAGLLLATTAATANAADAAALWTKNCQSCHGPDGKGKTKMGEKLKVKDMTSAEVKGKVTREKAIEAITKGVKEEGSDKLAMKAYAEKLSPAEIEALADHSLAFK